MQTACCLLAQCGGLGEIVSDASMGFDFRERIPIEFIESKGEHGKFTILIEKRRIR